MKIEVLVGMIASGKSTYALQRAREGAIIYNNDAVVEAVHGGDYKLYDERLKGLYDAVQMSIMYSAIKYGRDLVIDKTNLNRIKRQRYVHLGILNKVRVVAVVFPMRTPEEHAERRFKADARGYSYLEWLNVAKQHLSEYSPVAEHEGFDEIVNL